MFNPVTDVPLEMWQFAIDEGEMFNSVRPNMVFMVPYEDLPHAGEIEITDGGHILESHLMFGAYDPPSGGVVVAIADHTDPKFMKRRIAVGEFSTIEIASFTGHNDALRVREVNILIVTNGHPDLLYKSFDSIEEYIAAHSAAGYGNVRV